MKTPQNLVLGVFRAHFGRKGDIYIERYIQTVLEEEKSAYNNHFSEKLKKTLPKPMPPKNSYTKTDLERFVQLHSESQQSILAFIQTLVFGWANAEEVLQETNITIWKKREDFDLDTNFMHWAKRIAYYKVLQFQKKSWKDRVLNDRVMGHLASDMINKEDATNDPDSESEALEGCIQKLSEKDQKLLRQRYFDNTNVQSISKMIGRSPRAIYIALQRIRNSLRDCILRSLAMEGENHG